MSTETLAVIFIAVFGTLFTIIGFFVANIIKNVRDDIKELFTKAANNTKSITDFEIEVAKNYMTKDDCEKQEEQRQEIFKRIDEYRRAHNPASVTKSG